MGYSGSTHCKYCGLSNCHGSCVNNWKPQYLNSPHYELPEPAPKPLPPLPKGELIGYRCWNIGTFRTADPDLVEVGGQLAIPYAITLRSMNGIPWPGPVMHADEMPTRHNTNGIYVLKNDKQRYDRLAHVSGSIMLYGKIVEHRDGYRAEHAMVRQLTLHVHNLTEHLTYPETPDQKNTVAKQIASLAQVLERRYECEVLIDSAGPGMGNLTAADLEAIAKAFGK